MPAIPVTLSVPDAVRADPRLIPNSLNRYRVVLDPATKKPVTSGDWYMTEDWDAKPEAYPDEVVVTNRAGVALTVRELRAVRPQSLHWKFREPPLTAKGPFADRSASCRAQTLP
ncbi:hypothetical protein [Dactylosporangium matsuzakiense]|uniref:Uncharacterized protein n=1 Tax=Dactylosporangium matsuzakiense TaxID=53360 RepID=A0A9W6KV66_9ACTN|nr:hypothetical protein [Dactylosporangium matsuzakiense]UWZ41324.1 hypothetical protein Dmats_27010 [Dactylosporangium matsuzakiense]GLL07893.1 hypothetical protein GCM10017581_096520 [Dactylosporangium matsuzakiense]